MSETATAIPPVPSPFEGKRLGFWDFTKISLFWFATNFLWGALLTVNLPSEIETLAPQDKATALGWVTGLAAAVAMIVPLFAGAMSDRCASRLGRRRPYLLGGVLINLVGLAAMVLAFQAKNLVLYGAAFMIVQFGNNAATAAFSGIIPDQIPSDQRGTASGYMAVMSQIGTLFGAFLVGDIFGDTGIGTQYAILGGTLAVLTVISMFTVKEIPLPHPPPKIVWSDYLKSLWIDPRKYPDFAWVWITRAFVMLGFYMVLPYIQYYLGDVIRVEDPKKTTPMLLALILIGSAISGVLGGIISDRVGRKKVVFASNLFIAIMAVALAFCRTLEQTLVVGVLFGLGYGAYLSVDWALGTDVLPNKEDAAKDLAVWHIAMTFPQTIGSPLGGALIASFGMSQVMRAGEQTTQYASNGYLMLFLVSGICFLFGAVLLRNIKGVR